MNICHLHQIWDVHEVLDRRWVYNSKQGVRTIMQIIHRQESINDVELLGSFFC